MEALLKLPSDVKKKMYIYHVADKDISDSLQIVPLGLEETIYIIKEDRGNKLMSNLDLICSLEILNSVPLSRISEVLACCIEL